MRRARPTFRALIAAACVAVLVVGALLGQNATASAGENPAAEFDTVWLINQTRGAAGLNAVGQDPWLTVLARIHADELAASGTLWHQDLGVPLSWGWHWVAENVAYSSGLIEAHRALEQSPPHLENMRNPYAFAAGTGLAYRADRVYLVQLLAY